MATQTATQPSMHGKTGSSGSIKYNLPGSPTLTNPDMILPDYYDDPMSPERSTSPLTMWKNNQFDLNGHQYSMGSIAPTTPIIYGNGTMLSDIGEVTEAESTVSPVKSAMASRNNYQNHYAVKHPSNAFAYEAIRKKKSDPRPRERERRLSLESGSTITNGDRPGTFPDFDDSVSVDDSNFQGDDEDSVAASFIFEDNGGSRTPPAQEFAKSLGPDAEERYSTALSRRAEQILANAKRRLTTMEGNLHRARSSLSVDSGSEPSPPFSRPGTAGHRGPETTSSKPFQGHNRISSENNIQSDFKPATLSPRSSSALGVTGSYRQLLLSSRSVDFQRENSQLDKLPGNPVYSNATFSKSKASLHDSKYTLEPLTEDDTAKAASTPPQGLENTNLNTFLSPTFGSYDDKGLRRSASTAQMKDIKDTMEELKGRLSSLRDQARADSMKRRSIQSLRNASPFTHARDFSEDSTTEYVGGKSMKDIRRWNDGVESLHESDIGEKHEQEIDDDVSIVSGSVYSQQTTSARASPTLEDERSGRTPTDVHSLIRDDEIQDGLDDQDDMKTEDGYDDGDGDDDDDDDHSEFQDVISESGESDYHDTVQNQVSHEDREDAFDYEHFFLHSAMGSMSQKKLRRRGSQESLSSDDSVETTRGPTTNGEYRRRSRRGSNASMSSVDSFLTATEGRITRADNDIMEYFPEQVVTQMVALPERSRSHTPDTAKRATFDLGKPSWNSDQSQPRASVIQRPSSSAAIYTHRPSVSSMGSTGTNRSFPLINKPKMSNGILTPRDSPDQGLKKISESLMSDTASICESANLGEKPIGMLAKEDQILVERLVASLGKCVLGLTENGRASTEARQFRRRIETARQVLEGLDQTF